MKHRHPKASANLARDFTGIDLTLLSLAEFTLY